MKVLGDCPWPQGDLALGSAVFSSSSSCPGLLVTCAAPSCLPPPGFAAARARIGSGGQRPGRNLVPREKVPWDVQAGSGHRDHGRLGLCVSILCSLLSSVVGGCACVVTQAHGPGQSSFSLSVRWLSLHSLLKLLSLQAISAHSLCICHCSIYSFSFSIFIPALSPHCLPVVSASLHGNLSLTPSQVLRQAASRLESAQLHPSDSPHASGFLTLAGDPRSSGKTAVGKLACKQ